MSGDSEAPSTYYFSGIKFNPTFYTTTTDYLTPTTGKNTFYRIQQPKETKP